MLFSIFTFTVRIANTHIRIHMCVTLLLNARPPAISRHSNTNIHICPPIPLPAERMFIIRIFSPTHFVLHNLIRSFNFILTFLQSPHVVLFYVASTFFSAFISIYIFLFRSNLPSILLVFYFICIRSPLFRSWCPLDAPSRGDCGQFAGAVRGHAALLLFCAACFVYMCLVFKRAILFYGLIRFFFHRACVCVLCTFRWHLCSGATMQLAGRRWLCPALPKCTLLRHCDIFCVYTIFYELRVLFYFRWIVSGS